MKKSFCKSSQKRIINCFSRYRKIFLYKKTYLLSLLIFLIPKAPLLAENWVSIHSQDTSSSVTIQIDQDSIRKEGNKRFLIYRLLPLREKELPYNPEYSIYKIVEQNTSLGKRFFIADCGKKKVYVDDNINVDELHYTKPIKYKEDWQEHPKLKGIYKYICKK